MKKLKWTMRRHKQYILEWGSVSDTVEEISNKLSKKIWNDSKEKDVSLSDTYKIPFIEGKFDFKMFDGYIATVSYTFFLVDNMQQYTRELNLPSHFNTLLYLCLQFSVSSFENRPLLQFSSIL